MKFLRPFIAITILATTLTAQERQEIAVELSSDRSSDLQTIEVSDEFVRATKFAIRYFERDEFSAALERLQEANAMIPNHPAVLYNTAVVLVQMGRYAEAEEKIDSYLALYPEGEEASAVKNLQIELEFQRDFQRKQQADQSYVELFNRAKFAYEEGDYGRALDLFQQAEQLRPEDAPAIYNQALAHEAMGNYEKATERLRQYLAVRQSGANKTEIDRKIFQLENEIENRRTSFVCPFCGLRLPIGTTWCHRCWHGPYLLDSPRLNTLACGVGASATRTSFYSGDRLAKNETLECRIEEQNYLEQVRYSKGRQRAIQEARESEGWRYDGEIIQRLEQEGAVIVELVQEDYLKNLLSKASGDALTFSATKRGERDWQLDREEIVIDGRTYVKHYEYDMAGRISKERVRYQNDSACGHVIETTATYIWQGDRLTRVAFQGGNDGFEFEGDPKTDWTGQITWTYDDEGRITKETFEITSFQKTYRERPRGPMRRDVKRMYPQYRPGRALDIMRKGDLCAMIGSRMVGNPVDLRPFHSIAPNLAILIEGGVVKVSVDYTYPADFELPSIAEN